MSVLTDDELDGLLSAAGTRLSARTNHLAIGEPPRPAGRNSRPILAAVAACLVLAAASIVATTTNRRAGPGARPAGIDPSAIEITITRTDTHEPDAHTTRYTAQPAGGTFSILHGPRAYLLATSQAMTMAIDGITGIDTCWMTSGGETSCGPDEAAFGSAYTRRQPGGQMIFTGQPDGTVVQLRSPSVTYWARSIDGVVMFPYTDQVTGDARIEAFAPDGSRLWTELRYDGEGGETRLTDAHSEGWMISLGPTP